MKEIDELKPVTQDIPAILPNDASTIMNVIERMATMPDLDINRVERMFVMHNDLLAKQAEKLFNTAMAKTQGAIQGVIKNAKAERYSYANLDALFSDSKPIWCINGFSVVTWSGPSDIPFHVKILCDLRHSGGHKEHYEDDWPLDTSGLKGVLNKTPIQGKGSTTSYARRYMTLMLFGISTKDDNDGARANPTEQTITSAQLDNLRKAMLAAGVDDSRMCEKAGIEKLEDLAQGNMRRCIDWLKKVATQTRGAEVTHEKV